MVRSSAMHVPESAGKKAIGGICVMLVAAGFAGTRPAQADDTSAQTTNRFRFSMSADTIGGIDTLASRFQITTHTTSGRYHLLISTGLRGLVDRNLNFVPMPAAVASPVQSERGLYFENEIKARAPDNSHSFDLRFNLLRYKSSETSQTDFGGALFGRLAFPIGKVGRNNFSIYADAARTSLKYVPPGDIISKEKDPHSPFASPGWSEYRLGILTKGSPWSVRFAGVVEQGTAVRYRGKKRTGVDMGVTYYSHEGSGSEIRSYSAYAIYKIRAVNPGTGTNDGLQSISVGASGNRGPYTAGIALDAYYYDGRQPGAVTWDYSGSSAYMYLSYGKGRFWSYASFSGDFSKSHASSDQSRQINYDASLTVKYRLNGTPDLVAQVSKYKYDGAFVGSSSRVEKTTVAVGVDLAKYVFQGKDLQKSSFPVLLERRTERRWDGALANSTSSDGLGVSAKLVRRW